MGDLVSCVLYASPVRVYDCRLRILGDVDQHIRHHQKTFGRPGDTKHRSTEREITLLQIFERPGEFQPNAVVFYFLMLSSFYIRSMFAVYSIVLHRA